MQKRFFRLTRMETLSGDKMKVLYKSDTDYIVLPSADPFVQKNQAFLIEMGYCLIEDWVPPVIESEGRKTED
jgi:hypothetical protein